MPEPPPEIRMIKIVLPAVSMLIVYSCSIVRCGRLCDIATGNSDPVSWSTQKRRMLRFEPATESMLKR
jgi:hypothetical protein